MRNLKRVLSLALALVMVLGMMVITTSAATFADEDEITYKEAVEVMNAIGIVTGDAGYFNPTDTLTREGAAKILAFICMGPDADDYLTGSIADPFTDVAADRWSAKYVTYCKNLGIINGVDAAGTIFNPKGNISTVGFGKLILGAVEIDGTYTGAGWEDNVKTALEKAELDVVTIDNTDITREEACQMALAAMKYTGDAAKYNVIKTVGETVEVLATYNTARDAALDVIALGGAGAGISYVKAPATGYLLNKSYEVSFIRDTDDFGRPGVRYYNGKTGAEKIDLFYADTALATYEGPVTEETLFAAAGVKNPTATSFTYNLIEDGSDFHGTFTAAKAKQASAKWTAAGTGYGIKSELYKVVVGDVTTYYLIAIRDYMGTVAVTEATEDEDRYINVTLDKLSTGYETTDVTVDYETEEFKNNDRVLVNVSWTANGPKIQSIALAEAVEGKVTKITDKGVYTIGGNDYVMSQNWVGTAPVLNVITDGEWYVDSQNNLIAVKTNPDPIPVWNYGYLIEYAAQVKTTGTLLGAAAKENAEKFVLINAAGEKVTLDGAFTTDKTGAVTAFVYPGTSTTNGQAAVDKAELVRYTLNADGQIKKLQVVVEGGENNNGNKDADGLSADKGTATLTGDDNGTTVYVNDKTLFFVWGGTPTKYDVYVGFNSLPVAGLDSVASSSAEYFYGTNPVTGANTTDVAAVVLKVANVAPSEQSKTQLVWYATTDNYTSKNADGNTVTTYTNVYLNGVKGEISFEGEHFAPEAATLYYYTTDSKTGYASTPYNAANGNEGKFASGAIVSKIEAGYYVTNHGSVPVVYVDEDTQYFQVDATTKAVTIVEGLPAITNGYNIRQISLDWTTENNYNDMSVLKPAEVVYFTVVKAEG